MESRVRGIETAIRYVLYAVLLICVVGIEARVHRAAGSRDCRNGPASRARRIDRKLIRDRTVHAGPNASCVDGHGAIQIAISGKLHS